VIVEFLKITVESCGFVRPFFMKHYTLEPFTANNNDLDNIGGEEKLC